MGHYVHYNTIGTFWHRYRDGQELDIDKFMEELVAAADNELFNEFIYKAPSHGDCTMFGIFGNGSKHGRPMDQAYGRCLGFLRKFAKKGEKWDNVQWVELCMYSEFRNLDRPTIDAAGNWLDWPEPRPGKKEYDWSSDTAI